MVFTDFQMTSALQAVSVLSANDRSRFLNLFDIDQAHETKNFLFEEEVFKNTTLPDLADLQVVESLVQGTTSSYGDIDKNYAYFLLSKSTHKQRAKVLGLTLSSLKSRIESYFGVSFTEAEHRLMAQLLVGLTLSTAAEVDGVSTDAKRFHLKSINLKTHSTRQSELVHQLVLGSILHLDHSPSNTDNPDAPFWDYCSQNLPAARPHVMINQAGQHQRIIDFGPVDGDPIILLHPQVMPSISLENLRTVNQMGLRLIWPLRNGALAPKDKVLSFAEHAHHARLGIDAARMLVLHKDVKLVGLMSGCYYLIEYLREHKDLQTKSFLVGPPVKPVRDSSAAGRLRSGLLDLVKKNQTLSLKVLEFMSARLSDEAKFFEMMSDIYSKSPPDLLVLEEERKNFSGGREMQDRFRSSLLSIQQDFYAQSNPNFSSLSDVLGEIELVHGECDPMHTLENVEKLMTYECCRKLHIITEGGQLLYFWHLPTVLDAITARNGHN